MGCGSSTNPEKSQTEASNKLEETRETNKKVETDPNKQVFSNNKSKNSTGPPIKSYTVNIIPPTPKSSKAEFDFPTTTEEDKMSDQVRCNIPAVFFIFLVG